MFKNVKNLKKNKKGFTLMEIIVVLVIMGILLAIAVPAILGYVSKANDQKFIAQARNGYVGAQGILARENATQPATRTVINGNNLNTEIQEDGAINSANCTFTKSQVNGKNVYNVNVCEITVKGDPTRHVTFNSADGTSVVSNGAATDGAAYN
ncbi:type II secretion system protein [Amedibacillus sp. YH-ame10]